MMTRVIERERSAGAVDEMQSFAERGIDAAALGGLLGRARWLAALTPGERDVLTLLAGRRSDAQIAETLALAPLVVESSLDSLYRKLGVRTRDALAAYARYQGLGAGSQATGV